MGHVLGRDVGLLHGASQRAGRFPFVAHSEPDGRPVVIANYANDLEHFSDRFGRRDRA